MGAVLYALPETGHVVLSHDVVVAADDLQRFLDAGGKICMGDHSIEVRGTGGDGPFARVKSQKVDSTRAFLAGGRSVSRRQLRGDHA